MKQIPILGMLLNYANSLKFKKLFLLTVGLFAIDLILPDIIPLIDEIILGLIAIVLANWKKEKALTKEGNIIEGEVIDEDEKRIKN